MKKEQIVQALNPLVGMPLWSIGRAGDLEWFQFGSQRDVTLSNGKTKVVGEYALHVECAWRIVNSTEVFVGSRDRFYPAGEDPYVDLVDFDWDKPGTNRCDERVSILMNDCKVTPLIVEAVNVDYVGYIRLALSGGYWLEIFPDDSVGSEYWRLFRPYTDIDHFVFTAPEDDE
jgi:hypothetical protein